jgi:hypothetical protein
MSPKETIRVGGREVAVDTARSWVRTYLNGMPGLYAYPSYDGYTTNDDPDHLCDGDLLAPVLLNVGVKIEAFADMREARGELDLALQRVPQNVDLVVARDEDIARVAGLYSILDSEHRPRSVRGTTLAKVLHRKRPYLIPLFDKNVRDVYRGKDAPIPRDSTRSWVEFMALLAAAMRDDLNRCSDTWDELVALAPTQGPSVSRLRALDIVAWRLGGSS